MEAITGIYKITSPSKKIYIGQSVDIKRRWTKYRCPGFLTTSEQAILSNSFKKYGVDKHKFEIIHRCEVDDLNDLEIYYIDLYQTFNSEHGMNCRTGGKENIIYSDELRKRLSDVHMGQFSGLDHYDAKSVDQYDMDGNFIKTWNYMKEVTKTIGIPNSKICLCCKNKRKSAGGFRWTYSGQELKDLGEKYSSPTFCKKVNQYDLDGNFIKTWDSASSIKNEMNISKVCISSCCRGVVKTSYGFIWKYAD